MRIYKKPEIEMVKFNVADRIANGIMFDGSTGTEDGFPIKPESDEIFLDEPVGYMLQE